MYFATVSYTIHADSIMLLLRICVSGPTPLELKALAFRHALYHACVNGVSFMKEDGLPRAPSIVLSRASEISNHCSHLVGGRCD